MSRVRRYVQLGAMALVLLAALPTSAGAPDALAQGAQAEIGGHFQDAVRDYSAAIAAGLDSGAAYIGRGRSRLALGKLRAAAADFRSAQRHDPGDGYAAIWFYLAEAREGRTSRALAAYHAPAGAWPYPVIQYLQGKRDWEATLDAALAGEGAARDQHACEAMLFLAEHWWATGKRQMAIDAFAGVMRSTRCVNTWESALARAEFGRLHQAGFRPRPFE